MRVAAITWLLAGCVDATATSVATSEVIGGQAAPDGKWPDIAAVNFAGAVGCTGVLIAPTVVLTAGHCNDPELDSVLVGTANLLKPKDGETIAVARRVEYESAPGAMDSFETHDLTVLVLAEPSAIAPRPIATGWARFDIVQGAEVTIAGFGAVNEASTEFRAELQEAITTITDPDCTVSLGCNASVAPGGELGAGGMGIDTCQGDSGGPLYLMTSYGTFLAGTTSRAYDDAPTSCKDGGIYARPDSVIDWIEASAGVSVSRGPEPTAPPIRVVRGHGEETTIAHRDPHASPAVFWSSHAYEIVTPPSHGVADVRSDGRVRYCADPATDAVTDTMLVSITDTRDPRRTLTTPITVEIAPGEPPEEPCDVEDFDGGGCCDSGGGGTGSLVLGAAVLALVARRRRVG